MLSDKEKELITEEIGKYPQQKAACIEALKIVQDHHGWVSDESVDEVGKMLGMTASEVDNVATFYNLIFRKPVGEHVILFCDSISCWVGGYEHPLNRIKEKLGIDFGQTTADNKFTLLPIQCLGNCDKAPSMIIDNETYDNLTSEKIEEILARYQ